MSEKSTFEKLIKSEYERNEVPFNESLWNQLDNQLIPYRNIEEKKKRRVIAWWSIAAIALLGGTYFLLNQNNRKTDSSIISEKSNPAANKETATTNVPNSAGSINQLSQEQVTSNVENIQNANSSNNDMSAVTSKPIHNNKNEKEVNIAPQATEYDADANLIRKRTAAIEKNKKRTNNLDLIVKEGKTETEEIKEEKTPEVSKVNVATEEKRIVKDEIPEKVNQTIKEPTISDIAIITEAKKIDKKEPLEIYTIGGLNMASPFDKAGYFGAIQVVKPIDDKRIFAGIKLSNNNLNHQFIASKNTSTSPNTTDAVINKMTVIQIPFGYQFLLSKAKNKFPLQLNVGFEPSFITGLQTIFYDDNGVIGGPRTPVMNSPLLRNAINKFNVSFIAGIQKQVTSKLGLSIGAGYNMIDLTDKQYYNRTSSNNNLKYLQLGLLYRLK